MKSVHGYFTTGGNINTMPDGIYYYNGWADMTGSKPFTNAYGIWIKMTPFNSLDESNRIDFVVNIDTGTIHVRKTGTAGSWVSK